MQYKHGSTWFTFASVVCINLQVYRYRCDHQTSQFGLKILLDIHYKILTILSRLKLQIRKLRSSALYPELRWIMTGHRECTTNYHDSKINFVFCNKVYSQYTQNCHQSYTVCNSVHYAPNFPTFHSSLYSTGFIISITLQCSIDCQPLPSSSMLLSLPSSPVWTLLAANQWALVYSNELVIGWAWCQRGSSTASRLYIQAMTHAYTNTFTHSQAKQKQWPHFRPCKPCLGGFINSDLHTPAFPVTFLFTSSFCLGFTLACSLFLCERWL